DGVDIERAFVLTLLSNTRSQAVGIVPTRLQGAPHGRNCFCPRVRPSPPHTAPCRPPPPRARVRAPRPHPVRPLLGGTHDARGRLPHRPRAIGAIAHLRRTVGRHPLERGPRPPSPRRPPGDRRPHGDRPSTVGAAGRSAHRPA